jgi:Fe-S cluster assembly protein SufD
MTTRANAPSTNEVTIKALSQRLAEPEWLLDRRLDALRAYEAMSMPNLLEEEWRRTDVSRVDFEAATAGTGDASTELRSELLPKGVVFSDLSGAAKEHEAYVKRHLHDLVKPTEWKIGALQAAGWQGGAFIHVPAGVEVEVPLTYALHQNGAPMLTHLLIVAEPNSSVTVVQESTGQAPSDWSLASNAVEIVAQPDSRVRFVDVQRMGDKGVASFSTIRAHLEHGAELTTALIGLGGELTRTKLEVTLAGEGARAEMLGLGFGNGKQHFNYVTLQDHIAPRTSSDLLFKAALDGSSSTVWNGTARIHKGAGQSEANQISRNLLLSEHAKAAPIPVLEIEAYDVLRCSHGATAGPLDEDQRFYLESRGVSPVEAQQLLVEAFFREVLDRLPDNLNHEELEQAIAGKLGAVGR